MSTSDGSIKILVKLDKKDFTKQVVNVQNDLTRLKGSLTKMAGVVGATFGGIGIFNFGKSVSLMATTTESNIGRVEEIFGNASDAITQFSKNNSKSLGMSKSAVAKYASTYGNLFSVFMKSQQENANMTTAYLTTTAVVASKTGRTVADVAERMRSGLLGNTEAIEDLGINVNIKTIEITESFKKIANGRSWEQLNAYEQAQVRQLSILEQATKKYGNTVANNGAFTNQQASASVENLKNSLGKLLNTVVVPAIKFFADLTDNVNSFISALFGLEVSTKKVETASSNNNDLSSGIDNVTSSATKAKKAMTGLLASFDDLNVLSTPESETDIPTQSNPSSPNMSPPIISTTQIDKTSEYSNKFEQMGKKVRETLLKIMDALKVFEPALKGIGGAFVTAFGFAFLAGLGKKLKSFAIIEGAILALKKAVKSFSTVLTITGKPLKALSVGMTSLWKSFKNFLGGLSPFAKFAVGATGFVAVVGTAKSAIKEFALGNKSLGEVLLNIIPIIGVVGFTLTAMLGPVGLLYTAIGVLVGAVFGLNDAQNQLQEEFIKETFFDGVGVGIESFTENIKKSQEQNTILNEKIINLGNTVEENGKKMIESKSDFDMYNTILNSTGTLTEEQATKMKESFDVLVSATKENLNTNIDIIYKAFYNSTKLAAEGLGINVADMTVTLEVFRRKFTGEIDRLNTEVQPLFEKLMSGQTLNTEEKDKIFKTMTSVAKLQQKTSADTIKFKNQLNESTKINFESVDQAKSKIVELGNTGKEVLTSLNDAKNTSLASMETVKSQMGVLFESGAITETAYNEAMSLFSKYGEGINEGYEREKKEIENSMSTVMGALEIGLEDTIKNTTENVIKNNSYSFADECMANIKMVFDAMPYDNALFSVVSNNVRKSVGTPIQTAIDDLGKQFNVEADLKLGKQLLAGLGNGVTDKNEIKKVKEGIQSTAGEINEAFKDAEQINSPSKVWKELGQYLLQGLANGITENKNVVVEALNGLLNAMTDRINIFMYNSIEGWKEMYRSMSNATGEMKYNTIIRNVITPKLPKLATGAVIPPNQQFMAILGDQTRGVNIETPLETMIEAFRIANSESPARNSQSPTTIILELDNREIGRTLLPILDKEKRRIGVKIIGGAY